MPAQAYPHKPEWVEVLEAVLLTWIFNAALVTLILLAVQAFRTS